MFLEPTTPHLPSLLAKVFLGKPPLPKQACSAAAPLQLHPLQVSLHPLPLLPLNQHLDRQRHYLVRAALSDKPTPLVASSDNPRISRRPLASNRLRQTCLARLPSKHLPMFLLKHRAFSVRNRSSSNKARPIYSDRLRIQPLDKLQLRPLIYLDKLLPNRQQTQHLRLSSLPVSLDSNQRKQVGYLASRPPRLVRVTFSDKNLSLDSRRLARRQVPLACSDSRLQLRAQISLAKPLLLLPPTCSDRQQPNRNLPQPPTPLAKAPAACLPRLPSRRQHLLSQAAASSGKLLKQLQLGVLFSPLRPLLLQGCLPL